MHETEPTRTDGSAPQARRRPGRLLLQSLAIGVASGARSSWGLLPPALAAGPLPLTAATGLVATELVVDKRPTTPSRIDGGPMIGRLASAAAGSAVLARRDGAVGVGPAVAAGLLGAVAGSVAGATWRAFCADRGWARQGAVVEDVASAALTAVAVKV